MSNDNVVKFPSVHVSKPEFFGAYQLLLEEKGFDENGTPLATLKDLASMFPTLKPITVKQKLYMILSKVNENGHNYPMLPTGEARKKRASKAAQVMEELLKMAESRKVFDSVD